MDRKATIVLGGEGYEIGPLKLGQLKRIGIGSASLIAPSGAGASAREEEWYTDIIGIIACAMGKTPEELEALLSVTRPELIEASTKIFLLTGLVPAKAKEAPKLGEGEGAATG